MIRLPLPQNEDEAKRRLNDVRSTLYLFGVMVVIIRLSKWERNKGERRRKGRSKPNYLSVPPVLRFVHIQ